MASKTQQIRVFWNKIHDHRKDKENATPRLVWFCPVKQFGNEKPLHPCYGGWDQFFAERCELRDVSDGVLYYGSVNCNYVLFPDGTLVQSFGDHGWSLMSIVREQGCDQALSDLKRSYEASQQSLQNLLDSIDNLTGLYAKSGTDDLTSYPFSPNTRFSCRSTLNCLTVVCR